MSMTVGGIQFFNNRAECFKCYEEIPVIQKVINFFKTIWELVTAFFWVLTTSSIEERDIEKLSTLSSNDLSKRRLVVCIHGLKGEPLLEFSHILEELQKKDLSETAIFIPPVLEGGAATLDAMVQKIFTQIQRWASEGQHKELVLIGVSNGARISRGIEAKLTKEARGGVDFLQVLSIVGARRGSSFANLAHRYRVGWALAQTISKAIADEMPRRSSRNQQLDKEWSHWAANLDGLTCDYTFIASAYDAHVPNWSSSLPKMPQREGFVARYGFVMNHGHFTAAHGSAEAVAEVILPSEHP